MNAYEKIKAERDRVTEKIAALHGRKEVASDRSTKQRLTNRIRTYEISLEALKFALSAIEKEREGE